MRKRTWLSQEMCGSVYGVLGSLFLALMAFTVSNLSEFIPFGNLLVVRSAFVLVFIFPVLLIRNDFMILNWRNVILRGFFGGISVVCYFFILNRLQLSNAMFLANTVPLFLVVAGWVFLGERLNFSQLCLVLFSVFCLVVVNLKSAGELDLFSVSVGLFGSFFSSLAYFFLRKSSKQENAFVVLMSFSLFGLGFGWILSESVTLQTYTASLASLAFMAVCSLFGQLLMTLCYKALYAPIAAVIMKTTLIFGLVLEGAVLGRSFEFSEVLFSLLFVGAISVLAFQSSQLSSPGEDRGRNLQ